MAISSAAGSALALCSNGAVAAWGAGASGQLGNGGTTSTVTPTAIKVPAVMSGKTVKAIASGGAHGLALTSDGRVFSWGSNTYGQLGDGTTTTSNVPVAVNAEGLLAGRTVTSIMAGLCHNLALCSDGTLFTWGRNDAGQLGNGSRTDSAVPVLVTITGSLSGKRVRALSQCAADFCAVLCWDGSVITWGADQYGQLGNGGFGNLSTVTVAVSIAGALSGKTVESIASGYGHTLASCSDGTLVSWGYNEHGQLGNGTTSNSQSPLVIGTTGLLYGKKVLSAAGAYHSLAIVAESDTGYISWINGLGNVSDRTMTADPDLDGLPNLMEYVLAGDPAQPSIAVLPGISASGGDFVFSFNRLHSSWVDTTQIFQHSTDMLHWTDQRITAPTDGGVAFGPVDGNGKEPVTVTVPNAGNARVFGRLKVSRP